MALKVLRRQDKQVEVQCPFCKGSGLDPLKVMSSISNCPACGGKKASTLEDPLHECAFCRGSGVHPYTRMTCTACLGKGAVTLAGPAETCPRCGGTGANGHDRMPCAACKGIGVVPAERSLERAQEKAGSAPPE